MASPSAVALVEVIDSGPDVSARVRGSTVLAHTVHGLLASGCVHAVGVLTPASHRELIRSSLAQSRALSGQPSAHACVHVIDRRGSRTESIRVALASLEAEIPTVPSAVLLQDAVRPFTPPSLIRTVVEAVGAGAPVVVPVLPVADTIKTSTDARMIIGTEERASLRTAQRPYGFRRAVLRQRCHAASLSGDGTDLLAEFDEVHTVTGHPQAMPIATPFDAVVAEALVDIDPSEATP